MPEQNPIRPNHIRPSPIRSSLMQSCGTTLAAVTMFVGLAVASGCDTRPPQVTVESAVIERTSDDHARVLVRMLIHNPNDDSISLEEFTYRVGPYHGLRHPGMSLVPHGDTMIELPAVVPIDAARDTMTASGRVAWVPTGVISRSLHDTRVIRRKSSFGGSVTVQ